MDSLLKELEMLIANQKTLKPITNKELRDLLMLDEVPPTIKILDSISEDF